MPLGTNPNKTVPIWLECDADVPEADRPTFRCRFHTRHQYDALYEELNAILAKEDYEAQERELSAFIAAHLVAWQNVTDPDGKALAFAPDPALPDLFLTSDEKFELAKLILNRPRVTERESKKSSSSAPPTGAGSSAPPAATPDGAQETT